MAEAPKIYNPSRQTSINRDRVSRRRFLVLGAGAGGAIASLELFGPRVEAATAKVSKQTVSYQQNPKGEARCGTCSFFEAPGSCNYVDGSISPAGWCVLYKKKG